MRLQDGLFMKKRQLALMLVGVMLFVTTACAERVERFCVTPAPAGGSRSIEAPSETSRTGNLQTSQEVQAIWQTGPHSSWLSDLDLETDPECIKCHTPLAILDPEQLSKLSSSGGEAPAESTAGCMLCHPQKSVEREPGVAWLVVDEEVHYEPIDTIDEPCKRCHVADEVDGHLFVRVEGVHEDFLCTDCHDPHTSAASCSDDGCHQPFQAECDPILTHDKPHASVTCSGCHAAEDVVIKWDADLQAWHSFSPVQDEEQIVLEGQYAHDLTEEVICERCHTPGELPWMVEG
jgi:hypothetical protein